MTVFDLRLFDDEATKPELPAWMKAWDGDVSELFPYFEEIDQEVADHLFASKLEAFCVGFRAGLADVAGNTAALAVSRERSLTSGEATR